MNRQNLAAFVLLAASAALLWWVFGEHAPAPSGPTAGTPASANRYAPRDWEQPVREALNISLFTFRDRNRDGVYDTGDLPMAMIDVDLLPQGGTDPTLATQSNINGYANFEMHRDDPQRAIHDADRDYLWRVAVPPGWSATSGNAEQRIHFREMPGAPTGLIAAPPPQWVGLAADLEIRWQVDPAAGDLAQIRVEASGPDDQTQALAVRPDGTLRLPAVPGRWRLRAVQGTTGAADEREFSVGEAPVELAPMRFATDPPAALPRVVTEDFEWLTRSIIDKLPNRHLGLDWDYLIAVDNQYYRGPGYVNGLMSGHVVGYNSSGHPVTVSARPGEKFDFVRGFFAVAWPQAHGEWLDVEAWRDGALVARHALRLSYLGPVQFEAELRGIDRLTLTARHYWQFVADDLVFRLAEH